MPEINEKIQAVHHWKVNQGLSLPAICNAAKKEGWDETPEQLQTLMDVVTSQLSEKPALDLKAEFATAYERLDHLYASAIKVQDYKTAFAIQKERTALLAKEHKAQRAKRLAGCDDDGE